jgi:hypothetical protein
LMVSREGNGDTTPSTSTTAVVTSPSTTTASQGATLRDGSRPPT